MPTSGDKLKTHNNKYHTGKLTIYWNGQKSTCKSNSSRAHILTPNSADEIIRSDDGLFRCPCGREDHARYDYHKFQKLMEKRTHPVDGALDCADDGPIPARDAMCVLPDVNSATTPCEPIEHIIGDHMEPNSSLHLDHTQHSMDVDTSPSHSKFTQGPCPPASREIAPTLLRTELDARTELIHTSTFSLEPPISITRIFQGNALTSVQYDAELPSRKEFDHDALADEESDGVSDGDSVGDDNVSGDELGDDGFHTLEMPVDVEGDKCELLARALHWGILVDPTYNLTICIDCGVAIPWRHAHGHQRRTHKSSKSSLPDKSIVLETLRMLGAHTTNNLPRTAVRAIDGMRIIPNLIKCEIVGCTDNHHLFSSKRRFNEHCLVAHSKTPLRYRIHKRTIGHQMGTFRGEKLYFEVEEVDICAGVDALQDILDHAQRCGLFAQKTMYVRPTNLRPRGALLAQTNWEHCIENVDLKTLRHTVSKPDKEEPEFVYLVTLTQQYYKDVAANLGKLSTLTLRAIMSTSSSGDMEKSPFRPPQEAAMLEKYANFMARFIIFLIRHLKSPVDNFDVPLHPQHTKNLSQLSAHLQSAIGNPNPASSIETTCMQLLHDAIFSLLSCTSDEFLKKEWKDLFTLFLITYHLSDNFGNTSRVSQVPPTISQAQWCFRATAAGEIMIKMPQYDDNSFLFVFRVCNACFVLTIAHLGHISLLFNVILSMAGRRYLLVCDKRWHFCPLCLTVNQDCLGLVGILR
jgi:hypothetical protein